jgi:hypothetical protein
MYSVQISIYCHIPSHTRTYRYKTVYTRMNAYVLIQDRICVYERCISGNKSVHTRLKHFAKKCMTQGFEPSHGSHAHCKAVHWHTTVPRALMFLIVNPGPSQQRHRLPLFPLPAPLLGIGGGSRVDNMLQQKSSTWYPLSYLSGSTCCSLWTRYWIRCLEVTFLYQTDLSYFILVRYPTLSLFYPKYDWGRTFLQLLSHYILGFSYFIPCILGGEHFHKLYPLKYHE